MKKLIACLLCVLMILVLIAASADTYTVDGYYTVEYPDTLLLDDTTYLDENTKDVRWMFLLEGENFMIDAYISVVKSLAGFTLYEADAEGVQTYVDAAEAILGWQNPTLLEIVAPDSGIPFYVYTMEGTHGDYLYAETIVSGETVNFIAYYFEATDAPDEALLETLENLLYSFTPAVVE